MSNKLQEIVIHCNPSVLNSQAIKDGQLYYTNNIANTGEVDVMIVDKDDYDYMSGIDPDVHLCDKYDLDYDHVNCIELIREF
tara:strand:+ start:63 stop:308 length:246 start_codon:yes stop_codon:yes gene_type:complete